MAPPLPFVVGGRVVRADRTEGTIRGKMEGGRILLVAFDDRPTVPFLYPAALLTALSGAPTPAARPTLRPLAAQAPAPRAPQPIPVARTYAPVDRQSLEALRLGVVPVRGLDRLTVGRETERARLETLLDAGRGMLVLSGGYGAGKTHMLEVAEADALARGYLVGRATFDPVEVPPSHPLRLYRAVIEGLRYPGGTGEGLRPLFERLADSDAHTTPAGDRFHRWLSPAAWALRHVENAHVVESTIDFVEGRGGVEGSMAISELLARRGWAGPRLLALPDYRTFGQMMAHLLGGIAVWAKDAGYRGLVVMLDEAEFLDTLGATSREMAENVLRYLAVATLPVADLAFDPAGLYRGGQAVHRHVSPVYREDQPLLTLCAFTPHPVIDAALRRVADASAIRLDLPPIPERYFPLLADRVLGMVQEVHPALNPPDPHRRRLREALSSAFSAGEIETSRQAARLCIEFWDLYRDDPTRAIQAIRT